MTSISYAITFQNGGSSSRTKKTPTTTTTTTSGASSRHVRAGSHLPSTMSAVVEESASVGASSSGRAAAPPTPAFATFYEADIRTGSGSGDASSLPAQIKLPPRAASLKKKRLLMELEMLDQKLRQLDRQEASRRNKLQLRYNHNNNNNNNKSKSCSILSPSGESSTMEMTASSVSDGLEWKDVLQNTEITFIAKKKKEGGHEDNDVDDFDDASICSEVTLPLTPQEELERFINAEVAMMEDLSLVSSSLHNGGRTTPSSFHLETSSVTTATVNAISRRHSMQPQLPQRYPQRPPPPPPPPQQHHQHHQQQQQQHLHQNQQQRHHHHQQPPIYQSHPPHQPLQRHAEDAGDAQPGRVKNMPWLVTFADERPPLSVQYTGPIQNGIPHGVGTFRFRKSGDMYMGEVQHGRMHGIGMYRTNRGIANSNNSNNNGGSGGKSDGSEIRRGKFVCNIFQMDPTASNNNNTVTQVSTLHKPKSNGSRHKRTATLG